MSFKSSSAKVPQAGGLQYHTRLKPGYIPPYVLVPGDPKRVVKIAQLWDKTEEVADYRQYVTYKGDYKGAKLAATSSGMGSPGLATVVDELLRIGIHTFIRVGTCGSLQPDMYIGDLVITTGAVRLDGASKDYVIPEYPAVAHYEVVEALIAAAKIHKVKYHVGITASTDTFSVGQGRPGFNNYLPSHKANLFEDMQAAGVKNFEMEAGCLLTMGSLFNVRAGAICVVVVDRIRDKLVITDEMEQKCAIVASEAVKILQTKK